MDVRWIECCATWQGCAGCEGVIRAKLREWFQLRPVPVSVKSEAVQKVQEVLRLQEGMVCVRSRKVRLRLGWAAEGQLLGEPKTISHVHSWGTAAQRLESIELKRSSRV